MTRNRNTRAAVKRNIYACYDWMEFPFYGPHKRVVGLTHLDDQRRHPGKTRSVHIHVAAEKGLTPKILDEIRQEIRDSRCEDHRPVIWGTTHNGLIDGTEFSFVSMLPADDD